MSMTSTYFFSVDYMSATGNISNYYADLIVKTDQVLP